MFPWKYVAIGVAFAAALAVGFMRGQVSCTKGQVAEVKSEAVAVITKVSEDAKVSSDTHQQTVVASVTAKEKIREQAQVDRAAVAGLDDDSLRNAAIALAAAVRRANSGV